MTRRVITLVGEIAGTAATKLWSVSTSETRPSIRIEGLVNAPRQRGRNISDPTAPPVHEKCHDRSDQEYYEQYLRNPGRSGRNAAETKQRSDKSDDKKYHSIMKHVRHLMMMMSIRPAGARTHRNTEGTTRCIRTSEDQSAGYRRIAPTKPPRVQSCREPPKYVQLNMSNAAREYLDAKNALLKTDSAQLTNVPTRSSNMAGLAWDIDLFIKHGQSMVAVSDERPSRPPGHGQSDRSSGSSAEKATGFVK
jgi:hypothetical protein